MVVSIRHGGGAGDAAALARAFAMVGGLRGTPAGVRAIAHARARLGAAQRTRRRPWDCRARRDAFTRVALRHRRQLEHARRAHPSMGAAGARRAGPRPRRPPGPDRKSTRLNSSHMSISYAVFCLKKKKNLRGV